MSKIGSVTKPDVTGMQPEAAIALLSKTLGDLMVRFMYLNNEAEDLKTKLATLGG